MSNLKTLFQSLLLIAPFTGIAYCSMFVGAEPRVFIDRKKRPYELFFAQTDKRSNIFVHNITVGDNGDREKRLEIKLTKDTPFSLEDNPTFGTITCNPERSTIKNLDDEIYSDIIVNFSPSIIVVDYSYNPLYTNYVSNEKGFSSRTEYSL